MVIPKSLQMNGAFFSFSPSGKYVLVRGVADDYLLFDVKSGRQFASYIPPSTAAPGEMYYEPFVAFSPDDKYLLIPVRPNGGYVLYDILAAMPIREIPATSPSAKFTHAFFLEDSKSFMLVENHVGDLEHTFLKYFSISGDKLSEATINLPVTANAPANRSMTLLRLKLQMDHAPAAHVFAVSYDFKNFSCAGFDGSVFYGEMPKSGSYTPKIISSFTLHYFAEMRLHNGKVMLLSHRTVGGKEKKLYYSRDSLVIINPVTGNYDKQLELMVPKPQESSIRTIITGGVFSTNFDVYLTAEGAGEKLTGYVMKDLATDQVIRSWKWNNNAPYIADEYGDADLNGGFIVAVSADRRQVLENAGKMIIHDIGRKMITSTFTLTHNTFKLNAAGFMDRNHLVIPKNYDDALTIDLRDGKVGRLRQAMRCIDTLKGSVMNYAVRDDVQSMGVRNYCLSPDSSKILTADYNTNIFCGAANEKKVTLRNIRTDSVIGSYSVTIPNYSNYMEYISDRRFLLTNYLVSINAAGASSVNELKIVDHRKEFQCFHPCYDRKSSLIYGALSTVEKPGSADIIIAAWDTTGKLVRSQKIDGEKNNFEYREYVSSSRISSDGHYLIFSSFNGYVKVIDLQTLQPVKYFQYGSILKSSGKRGDRHDNVFDATFSPDGKRIAMCGNDGLVRIWSWKDDKVLNTIKIDTRLSLAVSFSPDSKWILVSGGDNVLRVFDGDSGKPIFYFIALSEDNWAMVNQEGYYFTNKKALEGVNFYKQGIVYDFSQFDAQFNRPDKILESFSRATPSTIAAFRKAWQKRLKSLGMKQEALTLEEGLSAPEINLTNLSTNDPQTDQRNFSCTVHLKDGRYNLKNLMVKINGVPIYGRNGMDLLKQQKKEIEMRLTFPLSDGHNRISISGSNDKGFESLSEKLNVTYKGVQQKPKLYIITIGDAQYAAGQNLRYAAKDANELSQLFMSATNRYDKIIPFTLIDQKVTFENVRALKASLLKTEINDQIIIFYAGHGLLSSNYDLYLGTYGIDFKNPEKKGIPYEELEKLLDSIPARNKLLLMDACNGGELDKEGLQSGEMQGKGMENTFELMKSVFIDLRKSTGATVISSSSSFQDALEGGNVANGVFSYSIITGLRDKKADINKNGKITVSELQQYVIENVPRMTRNKQTPTSRYENSENDMQIW